jgi:hypothetical protein
VAGPVLAAAFYACTPKAALAAEPARDLAGIPPLLEETGPRAPAHPGEDLARPADLALVWFDPSGALPHGFEALSGEVQRIFRGLGVEASWRVGGVYGGSEIPEVPVILLPRDPARRRQGQRIMGLVMAEQEPQRAVWLFLESVRVTLGLPPRPRPLEPALEGPLARALARVAAHEVIHAIAPDAPHARDGLMRHSLDRRFLLGAKAPIDPACATSFTTRLSEDWRRRRARSSATAETGFR